MRTPQFHVTSIALAVATCLAASSATAQSSHWTFEGDGYWSGGNVPDSPVYWSDGVPGANTDAFIDIAGNRTITYARSTTSTVRSLTVVDNTLQLQSGELRISGAYSNTGSGQTIIGSNTKLVLNGPSVMDTLVVQGSSGYVYGTGHSTVRNLRVEMGTLGSYQVLNAGTMTVTGHAEFSGTSFGAVINQRLNLNGTATWTAGNGYINLAGSSLLQIGADTTFQDLGTAPGSDNKIKTLASVTNGVTSGLINIEGAYVRSGLGTTRLGAVQNSGLLHAQAGKLEVTEGLNSNGTVRIDEGAQLTIRSPNDTGPRINSTIVSGSIVNDGVVLFERGQLDILQDARLSGQGEWRFGGIMSDNLMRFAGTHQINRLTIDGAGSLDVLGTLTTSFLDYAHGTLGQYQGGIGSVIVTGDALLQAGNSKTIQAGYKLVLNGQTRWAEGANTLNLVSGNSLVIGAQGHFVDEGGTAEQSRRLGGYQEARITNLGTFTRNGGGMSLISSTFDNQGQVNVNSGELVIAAGGSNTGTLKAGADGVLTLGMPGDSWSAGPTLNLDGSLVNDGRLRVNGGTVVMSRLLQYSGTGQVDITGGTLRVDLASPWRVPVLNIQGGTAVLLQDAVATTLNMQGGVRTGSVTLTVSQFNFNGGTLGDYYNAPGKTIVNGQTVIDGSRQQSVEYGHQLFLNGDTVWTAGDGSVNFNHTTGKDPASAIHIAQGTTFLDQGANVSRYLGMYSEYGSSTGTIHNAGRYVREGQGTTYMITLNNTGAVDVRSGAIELTAGGVNQGTMQIGAGAMLGMRYGRFLLDAGSLLDNQGTLRIRNQLDIDAGAVYRGNGEIVIESGRLNSLLTDTITTRGLTVRGTASFAGNVQADTVLIGQNPPATIPGSLQGPGTVTTGRLVMESADLGDYWAPGGTLVVTGDADINGEAWHSINHGYKLILEGTTNWQTTDRFGMIGIYGGASGTGELRIGTQGVFRDLGMRNAEDRRNLGMSDGLVTNAGLYERSGKGITDIYGTLANTGSVVAREGVLRINQKLDNTGTIEARGGRIEINGGAAGQFAQFDQRSGTLTGGRYRVVGEAPIAMALGTKQDGQTPALIERNQADISLEGSAARLVATAGTLETDALSGLARNEGQLRLLDGARLTIGNALTQTGQLVVGRGSTLLAQSVRQQGGSTFVGGQLGGSTLAFDSGVLSAGDGAHQVGQGTLSGATVSFGDALQLTIDVHGAQDWDHLVIDGNLALGGTLHAAFDGAPVTGTFEILSSNGQITATFGQITTNLDTSLYAVSAVYGHDRVSLSVTAVPEPGSFALMACGLASLVLLRRSHARARGTAQQA